MKTSLLITLAALLCSTTSFGADQIYCSETGSKAVMIIILRTDAANAYNVNVGPNDYTAEAQAANVVVESGENDTLSFNSNGENAMKITLNKNFFSNVIGTDSNGTLVETKKVESKGTAVAVSSTVHISCFISDPNKPQD